MSLHLLPHQCLSRPAYRLYQADMFWRWLTIGIAWTTLIPWALYQLREDIVLLQEHFTWAAIRYGLAFNLGPSFCLFSGIGITITVLLRHCFHLRWGLSHQERSQLVRRVAKIRKIGPRHPLWRWVFRP